LIAVLFTLFLGSFAVAQTQEENSTLAYLKGDNTKTTNVGDFLNKIDLETDMGKNSNLVYATDGAKAILDNAHLLLDKNSPNNGVKNSKFTLVEFFDYHCPYCIKFDKSVTEFAKDNKDVQIIYKDFAYQTEASRYAAVIGAFIFDKEGVEGYMKFHAEVYKQMEERKLNTKEQVEQIAKSITKKPIEHLEKYEMISQDSYELGRTIGVTGTPSAILIETGNPRGITTYMFRGAVSKDALQSKLNELKEIAEENK